MISKLFLSAMLGTPLFLGYGCASTAPVNSSTGPTPLSTAYETEDRIRKGDTLLVRLSGVPMGEEGVYEVQVDDAGQISMPYIGGFPAAGLTTADVKSKIESLYRMQRIYSNPNITVTQTEPRFVSVNGEVRSPTRIPYTKDLTLLGAIAACGGFTDFANRRAVILMRGGQQQTVNAVEIVSDSARDIPLLPDDKIHVSRSIF
jgi:polysaccharide export outer membrane protein